MEQAPLGETGLQGREPFWIDIGESTDGNLINLGAYFIDSVMYSEKEKRLYLVIDERYQREGKTSIILEWDEIPKIRKQFILSLRK